MPQTEDHLVGVILARLDKQDHEMELQRNMLEEVRTNTNGRLRSVEIWQARAEGARAAFYWVPTLVAGLLCAGVTALVTLLITHG